MTTSDRSRRALAGLVLGAAPIDATRDVDASIAPTPAAVSTADLFSGTPGGAPADPDTLSIAPYPHSPAFTPAGSVDADVRGGAGPQ